MDLSRREYRQKYKRGAEWAPRNSNYARWMTTLQRGIRNRRSLRVVPANDSRLVGVEEAHARLVHGHRISVDRVANERCRYVCEGIAALRGGASAGRSQDTVEQVSVRARGRCAVRWAEVRQSSCIRAVVGI